MITRGWLSPHGMEEPFLEILYLKTKGKLTLRVVGQDPVIINKSTKQSRELTPVSMMPPGLFENLTEQEIVDLVAYLCVPTNPCNRSIELKYRDTFFFLPYLLVRSLEM